MIATLVQLFVSYLKIGFFGFGGGYAMLSLIHSEVVVHNGWLTNSEFTDIVAISQMTPGPIAINSATYIGYEVAGIVGSVVATVAVCLPALTLMMLITHFFLRLSGNRYIKGVVGGMRPVVVALMCAPVVGLAKGMKWWAMAVAGAVALAVWSFGFSPIYLLIIAAVAGLWWAAHLGKEVER